MTLLTEAPAVVERPMVGMGQIVMIREPQTLMSVLGSCVGLALYHPRYRLAALAHVVLPSSTGRQGTPGKFADTAITELLRLFAQERVEVSGLFARLAGGANMFGTVAQPLQIGDQNLVACRQLLQKHRIPIAGEHVGGNQGRRITLCATTGQFTIEIAGKTPFIM